VERGEKRRIVEALVLAAQEPIPAARIAGIVPRCKPAEVRSLVDELNKAYIEQGRAFEICEVAGGYQMRTLPQFAPYLQQTLAQRPLRLSQAALETLSIVAYRQPVTRAEVEHIRGVDAGAVLRSLVERKLVRIAGHREVPGRPMLYATTRRFLEVFELDRLEDLPTLRDLRELAAEDVPSGVPLRAALGEAARAGDAGEEQPGSEAVDAGEEQAGSEAATPAPDRAEPAEARPVGDAPPPLAVPPPE
jgi:segregation and condensation protein B